MRVTCAVFFLLFAFFYVYDYQADVLYVLQHVLSDGVTTYNRTIGAVLIVALLYLLHFALVAVTALRQHAYAITYFPSMLILGILTDVDASGDHYGYSAHWLWLFPLLMMVYAGIVYVCRQLQSVSQPPASTGLFTRTTWSNLLLMILMAAVTTATGCNDDRTHFRASMECRMQEGDYDAALTVAERSTVADSTLTMLRVWALSEKGELGSRLFTYPLKGGSNSMLPNGQNLRLLLLDERRLYAHLGVVFRQKMRPVVFLEMLHRRHRATKAAHDWLLTAYLLDGRLDDFARTLPHFYKINAELPLHYREALTLYTHLRAHPHIIYHSTVMDQDYDDMQQLAKKYSVPQERANAIRDTYGKTYWWYYYELTNKI